MNKTSIRTHKEEYLFGDLPINITTDLAFTNTKDIIDLVIGDRHLNSYQAERLMGAILRAIVFSVIGQGIPLDPIGSSHPELANNAAINTVQRITQEIVQESFGRVLSDEGNCAAKVLLYYKMVAEAPKLLVPGKEQIPRISAVLPEFKMFKVETT